MTDEGDFLRSRLQTIHTSRTMHREPMKAMTMLEERSGETTPIHGNYAHVAHVSTQTTTLGQNLSLANFSDPRASMVWAAAVPMSYNPSFQLCPLTSGKVSVVFMRSQVLAQNSGLVLCRHGGSCTYFLAGRVPGIEWGAAGECRRGLF